MIKTDKIKSKPLNDRAALQTSAKKTHLERKARSSN